MPVPFEEKEQSTQATTFESENENDFDGELIFLMMLYFS